jgi:glycosyltransferase involved in cell wall biosynthesis
VSAAPITSSIVIPCYNGRAFLPDTIASIAAQTRAPDEVILVDDGSTDGSADVAARLDPSIRVIRQANQGESVARNVGLRAATADYVLFLDADDLLTREALAHLLTAVERVPGAVAVMGMRIFTDDPDAPVEEHIPTYLDFFPTIVRTNFGPPHCWFTPRRLALTVGGFREDIAQSEDWEFWARIALTGAPLVSVPYVGALYRRHARSQVSTTPEPAIFRGRLLVCEVLSEGILERPDLFRRTADVVFWSLCAMLRQARSGGVALRDVRHAQHLAQEIARRRPERLRRSLFAAGVRWFGFRAADRLRAIIDHRAEHTRS